MISFIVFYLGILDLKLSKSKNMLLFILNVAFLLFTYKSKVYLFNIVILSCVLWGTITPLLTSNKNILSLSIVVSLLSVYIFTLLNIHIPLFTIVFYPVYLLGVIIKNLWLDKSLGKFFINLICILISLFVLIVFEFKVKDFDLINNIMYLKLSSLDAKTAVYLTFTNLFIILLLFSIFYLLFNFTGIFEYNKFYNSHYDKHLETFKKDFSTFLSFALINGIPIFISEFLLRGHLKPTLKSFFYHQTLFNIIFLAGIYLTLISLFGKYLSTFILSVISLLLVFANYIKIKFFNEPFFPWEMYLIKNALLISKQYINIKIILGLSALLLTLIFILLKYKKNIKKIFKIKPKIAALPIALTVVIPNFTIVNSSKFLSELNMGKSWYVGKQEMLANGFFVQNYLYLTEMKKYLNNKPKGYSKNNMLEIDKDLSIEKLHSESNIEKPNVIVIMSESFWDPTQLNGVSFNKDITQNLRKYKKGEIISPVFGGGTANTEFEALTGFSMYYINPGIIPYNVYLRRNTPSIASVFKENGYQTTAIHPNVGDFYNRTSVYKYFGFDEFIDIKGFDENSEKKGPHISDEKTVEKILSLLNRDNNPKFIFAVTMQNHDPYYGNYENLEVEAKSDNLDEIESSILSNFGQGIYDADKSLGQIINALSKTNKPTLLYFFGDHLPRLGYPKGLLDIYNNCSFFEGASVLNKDLRLYKTPFVTWSNYKNMQPINQLISPAQIAFEILTDSEVKYPNYFNILKEIRAKYPIMHNNLKEKVNSEDEIVKKYEMIQYDLLFGKQYLNSIK
ncbi:sulfatase [Fervidicella metallireducens AeB]|uniref:Sulfatase n=2 Tax=Fervidicella TaxID=1403538 RepID=A0A017RXQ0_9CLOT|nr:sulfatase [Fervidicella metallireducens AeB]